MASIIIAISGCSVVYAAILLMLQQQRIKELREANTLQQARIDHLLEKFVPALRERLVATTAGTAGDMLEKKKHAIAQIPGGVACACGEKFYSDDPGKLQEKIEEHSKQFSFVPMSLKPRKSWSALRDKLENQSEEATK